MPAAYSDAQKAIAPAQLRLMAAAGINLLTDIENLSDEIAAVTAALGGPDAFAQGTHVDLNFAYGAGRIGDFSGAPVEVPADTIALTDDATNYVECDVLGEVSANVTAFTAGRLPLYVATTLAGDIIDVDDKRVFAVLLAAGAVGTSELAAAAVTGPKLSSASELILFGRQLLGASQTGSLYTPHGCTDVVMDTPGYLIGLSGSLSAALVGGSALLKPTINGVAVSQTGLNVLLDVSNPQFKYATVAYNAHAAYHYAAGDRLSVDFVDTALNPDATLHVAAVLRLRRE